jgi:hypothetical protein
MAVRGGCDFTTKAEVAQSGGAAALLVINDEEGCNLLSCWNAGELVIYPLPFEGIVIFVFCLYLNLFL